MMKHLNAYLNQPFPYPGRKWKMNVLWLSMFVSIFLLIFQPIGISIPYKQLILIGYGVVGLFVGIILHLICLNLFPGIFEEETWTIKRHLLWFLIQLVFIGVANHYYTIQFLPSHPKGLEGILIFQLRAISLGIFPITLNVMLTHNILLTKNLKEATDINKHIAHPLLANQLNDTISFVADNEKDKVVVLLSELYFVESVGNYIQIYYFRNNVVKNILLRCSLKRAETISSNFFDIIKCHRAYLVNTRNVTFVKGNSQGYRLCFDNFDKEIPVARNFSKIVRDQIKAAHKHSFAQTLQV